MATDKTLKGSLSYPLFVALQKFLKILDFENKTGGCEEIEFAFGKCIIHLLLMIMCDEMCARQPEVLTSASQLYNTQYFNQM